MIASNVRNVLEKLNKQGRALLEGAVGSCVTRSHYEVSLSHFLNQAMEDPACDVPYILAQFKIDANLFKTALQQDMKEMKTGNTGKPVFSPYFHSNA